MERLIGSTRAGRASRNESTERDELVKHFDLGPQNNHGDVVPGQVLLVAHVRVSGNQHVVLARDAAQEVAVADALPAQVLDVDDLVVARLE